VHHNRSLLHNNSHFSQNAKDQRQAYQQTAGKALKILSIAGSLPGRENDRPVLNFSPRRFWSVASCPNDRNKYLVYCMSWDILGCLPDCRNCADIRGSYAIQHSVGMSILKILTTACIKLKFNIYPNPPLRSANLMFYFVIQHSLLKCRWRQKPRAFAIWFFSIWFFKRNIRK